jgi:hypothetical protein
MLPELIIRTEADQMPGDNVLERLQLGFVLGSANQFDAGRRGFEVTCSEVELQPSRLHR